GWNLVAKATLGVWASLLLAATTPVAGLLAGLSRLRCPQILLQITAFAIRYAHLTVAEVAQMRRARLARLDDPRFLWQAGALARPGPPAATRGGCRSPSAPPGRASGSGAPPWPSPPWPPGSPSGRRWPHERPQRHRPPARLSRRAPRPRRRRPPHRTR